LLSSATEAGSKSQIAGNTDSRTVADGEGFRDVDGRSRRGGAVIFRVKVDADVLPFDIVLHHPALIDPPSTRYTITKRTRPSSTRATLGAKRAGRTESAAKPAVGYHWDLIEVSLASVCASSCLCERPRPSSFCVGKCYGDEERTRKVVNCGVSFNETERPVVEDLRRSTGEVACVVRPKIPRFI